MLEEFRQFFQEIKSYIAGKFGLKRASLGFKIITEDTDNFSLKGMLEPTFYNFGDNDVEVLHSVIKPGNKFFAGVLNMVMDNEVRIKFNGPANAKRKLIVYYGSPITDCD